MILRKEFGDYQTPESFSFALCHYLKNTRKLKPSFIIEPTCGLGSLVKNSLIFDAAKIVGIEVNPDYCAHCSQSITDPRVEIINANFFDFDITKLIPAQGHILALGNPPWVTNSTLSVLKSANLPHKANFKGLKGFDAVTGASNFDICEAIILRLVQALQNRNATIAMLCKTTVARNVFAELKRTNINFKSCDILEFDAKKVFSIDASACFFVVNLCVSEHYKNHDSKHGKLSAQTCKVRSLANPDIVKSELNFERGRLISISADGVDDFAGTCCFEWRQGVKHDCSKLMELSITKDGLINGLKEQVDIEDLYVYPLIKSSMFKAPIVDTFTKYVIVTQRKIKEDTAHIKLDAPKTWAYLSSHQDLFAKRKSSIYVGAPDFSMFGVGEYSYAQYKVGISGFYKKPFFAVLCSPNGRAVMVDDTSYFICLPSFDAAYTAMLLLNSEQVQRFLQSMAFLDSKRPYTKKLLERIDFSRMLNKLTLKELKATELSLELKPHLTNKMLDDFKALTESKA